MLEYLNEQATEVGVPVAKIPQRREGSKETEALKQRAIESLKAQRGAAGKLFNSSPSPKAVQAEVERLRNAGAQSPPAAQMVASHTTKPAAAATPSAPPQPGIPAQTQQQAGKAFLTGNQVTVNGQSYPLNPDGTVTISGRKYRVQ